MQRVARFGLGQVEGWVGDDAFLYLSSEEGYRNLYRYFEEEVEEETPGREPPGASSAGPEEEEDDDEDESRPDP